MKTYRALLTQNGNDAPTVVILENTVGDIVWIRSEEGIYIGSLANGFPENKTFLSQPATCGDETSYGWQFFLQRENQGKLHLTTFDDGGQPVDGLLNGVGVEILVYP